MKQLAPRAYSRQAFELAKTSTQLYALEIHSSALTNTLIALKDKDY